MRPALTAQAAGLLACSLAFCALLAALTVRFASRPTTECQAPGQAVATSEPLAQPPHICGTNCRVAYYPNGQRKFHTALSNGVPEGLSEGWYSNGVRQVEEHFRAGCSHGLRTKWYEGGQRQSEAVIVDGKLEGVFRRWHENGMLAEEVAMKENQPDGMSQAFYPSGCLKARVELRAGKVVSQQHWQDGERPPAPPTGGRE